MCTFPNPFVFSSDEIVAFVLVVEEVVNHVGLLYLGVITVCIQLNVLSEGFYVGIVTAQNYTGVIVILVYLDKFLNLC